MKTNTVVIISVLAVAGIAFYVASRPPATSTTIIEKQRKRTTGEQVGGFVETVWDKIRS